MATVDMPTTHCVLAMVALDALPTDQSSRALGCAQGARYGCPKAAASSLEQIVCTKAGSFTHPKDLMTSPRDHKDLDLLHADAQLRCAHEDQLCLGAQGPFVQQAIFMRVLIIRYPASEDRLIVRPLLCRRCALRLQPAEPQPYSRHRPDCDRTEAID